MLREQHVPGQKIVLSVKTASIVNIGRKMEERVEFVKKGEA